MRTRLPLLPVLASLALLACSTSPPLRYHSLNAPTLPDRVQASPAAFAIEVLPVGVPAALDIPQLAIRNADNSIILLENDRWLGPLSEEVHSALGWQLKRRLGTPDVTGLTPAPLAVVRLRVQIRRFESMPGKAVYLDADWRLSTRTEEQQTTLLCSTQLSMPVTGDSRRLFTAWQALTVKWAEQLAETARQWRQDPQARCPT